MSPWTPFLFLQSLHPWRFTAQPRVSVPSRVGVTPRLWVQKTTKPRPPNTAVLKGMPSRTPICQNFASSTFFFLSPATPHEAFAAPPRVRVPARVRVQKTINYRTPSTMQCYNGLLHLVLWLRLVPSFRKFQSPELQGFCSYISHGWYNTKLPQYGLSISSAWHQSYLCEAFPPSPKDWTSPIEIFSFSHTVYISMPVVRLWQPLL